MAYIIYFVRPLGFDSKTHTLKVYCSTYWAKSAFHIAHNSIAMDELLFYMFEFLVHYIIFYLSGDRWLRSTTTFVIHLISSEWAFPKPSHLQNYAESVGIDPNIIHSTTCFSRQACRLLQFTLHYFVFVWVRRLERRTAASQMPYSTYWITPRLSAHLT